MIRPHFGSSEPGDLRMIRTYPGSSGTCAQSLSGHVGMIRPYPGSSGPDIWPIYRAGGRDALTVLILSPPPLPLSSKPRAAIWHFNQDFFVVSYAFDSPCLGRSGPLRNSFDSRGNLKGISFKIPSPRNLNVGSSRRFPPVNHLIYLSRGHA
jgi:hypothetical protein